MGDRYRIDREGRPHVQHIDDAGVWCGPVVGKGGHSREGEIPGRVLCVACGDFCEGISAEMAEAALRFDRAWEREMAADEERAKGLHKLAAAGVDVATLPAPKPRQKARRAQQVRLPFGDSGGR